MIRLTLPWPPSQNAAYRTFRGRMLLSKPGRDYKAACILAIKMQLPPDWKPLAGRVGVKVVAIEPDRRRRDLQNLWKLPDDCLTEAGVFGDDSQIRSVVSEFADDRGPQSPGCLHYEVWTL